MSSSSPVHKLAVLSWLFFFLFTALPPTQATLPNSGSFDLAAALSRVPSGTWETIAFTDITATMTALDEPWIPTTELSPRQQEALAGVWLPDLLQADLATTLGIPAYNLERIVEARQGDQFILWLEGQYDLPRITAALRTAQYEPIEDFPAEAYHATARDTWLSLAPFISLPNGTTLLIASSQEALQTLLNVYDGLSLALLNNDAILPWLAEVSPQMTSAILRFDRAAQGCPAQESRLVVHGLRYNREAQGWEYLLNLGYPSETIVTNVQALVDGLEYSTYQTPSYGGVMGQHTKILSHPLYESSTGSILQFVMQLRPALHHLPFELAQQGDTCLLFQAPAANALALALHYLPDLSAGRVDLTLRFGNAEQALYNAGLNTPLTDQTLDEAQQIALTSTWRTDLAYEAAFATWFGFAPDHIRQVVELTLPLGDYARVIWGDFTTQDVETALTQTGYVALEQYDGTRLFTLRDAPEQGGFLLTSLAQTAASPADGVLVLSNQIVNMRLTLDIIKGDFRSPLLRAPEFTLTSRLLEDATNVTLKRFWNPSSGGGMICGLPAYKTQGFANVLRPDGWHFVYALGFNTPLDNAEALAQALAKTLEDSDYPLQGPGSETFGDLSNVVNIQTVTDTNVTVLLVDLLINSTARRSSFFGQELAQATLPPCALGDIAQ